MSISALYEVAAPAKINLFLHVVGRRADGYHLLQSMLVLIDWFDSLHFERRTDGRLARHDLSAILPDDDLCLRAARALQSASGTSFGVDISIDKQVPWGAGLGGGSSDAASTLLALNRLWGLDWPLTRLMPLGLALGADVPFFLGGHNAWVEGIGEQLTPVLLPREWIAVVKPSAGVETRSIFASPHLARNSKPATLEGFRTSDGLVDISGTESLSIGFGRNDLSVAAEEVCSEIGVAAALLQSQFGNGRMTGSGSAVFARAGTGNEALAAMPSALLPGWQNRMCRSLRVHPLCGWAAD